MSADAMGDVLSNLRHLYANMVNGCVRDTAQAKRIATGLLGPTIEDLEKIAVALATPSPQQAAGGEYERGYEQGRFDEQAAQGPNPYPDDAAPAAAAPSRGQKLADAGYTRRPSFRSLPPDEDADEVGPWRCFHCDAVFTDSAAAEQHFGKSEYQQPACQIDIAEYRKMEEVNRRHCEEDTDLHRQFHARDAEHQTALRREEEKGYARGLKDAAAAPEGLTDEEIEALIVGLTAIKNQRWFVRAEVIAIVRAAIGSAAAKQVEGKDD